jgi:hypothetical protein
LKAANQPRAGTTEMSERFKALGSEVSVDAAAMRESNRAL